MNNKLSKLADKFAMKLGLESRPSTSIDEIDDEMAEYKPYESGEFVPEEPPSEEELKYSNNPSFVLQRYLNGIRGIMHNMSEQISLNNYEGLLNNIENIEDILDYVANIVIDIKDKNMNENNQN
jgi:hypothetical protein